eukprot:2027276-Prymnesium_polylepis.1
MAAAPSRSAVGSMWTSSRRHTRRSAQTRPASALSSLPRSGPPWPLAAAATTAAAVTAVAVAATAASRRGPRRCG